MIFEKLELFSGKQMSTDENSFRTRAFDSLIFFFAFDEAIHQLVGYSQVQELKKTKNKKQGRTSAYKPNRRCVFKSNSIVPGLGQIVLAKGSEKVRFSVLYVHQITRK